MRFIAVVLLILVGMTANSQSKPNLNLEKLDDAVVIVETFDFFGVELGFGSGFFIDSTGILVTNYHVIENAYAISIRIKINSLEISVPVEKIIKVSAKKDLAILKVGLNSSFNSYPYLLISEKIPSKGEQCWAIGTPADKMFMNTVSSGLVSNLLLENDPKLLQTNTEITHGSSGGVLLNSNGEVIGVTTSGLGTMDGVRASINFGIWIGELKNLDPVNEIRLIKQEDVPCAICFYTNSSWFGKISLFVDGLMVKQIAATESKINCNGVRNFEQVLKPGAHEYVMYLDGFRGRIIKKGRFDIVPGEIKSIYINPEFFESRDYLVDYSSESNLVGLYHFSINYYNVQNITESNENSVKVTFYTYSKRARHRLALDDIELGIIEAGRPLEVMMDSNSLYKMKTLTTKRIGLFGLRESWSIDFGFHVQTKDSNLFIELD